MEDIEKWLSTDVVSEGLLSCTVSSGAVRVAWEVGSWAVYNSTGTAVCVVQAAWKDQDRKS